ncbi:MAG: riboflavin kinase [Candidatus Symbiodolus clandestinus]
MIIKRTFIKFYFAIIISLFFGLSKRSFAKQSLIESYILHQKIDTPQGHKIILVGGCFDVFHYGHLQFLKQAKALGTYLVVALESDQHIIDYKKRKPIHSQLQRAEILSTIGYVDKVLLLDILTGFTDYNQLVQDVKPNIIAITNNDPQIENKRIQANAISAKVCIVTERVDGLSSSKILNASIKSSIPLSVYTGTVIPGTKKARELGYKTANIIIQDPPIPGVYSGIISVQGDLYKVMCYYNDNRPNILESHLFNYEGNLYGKNITVILKNFIRCPQRLVGINEIKEIIKKDVLDCKACP